MQSIYFHIFFSFIISGLSEIHVNNIEMRPPRQHDIGLIFDVSIVNTGDNGKEVIEVRIRGEQCCINVTSKEQLCNINRIVGGYFGALQPGESLVVSILLPTITLYNRIGECTIGIMSLNTSEFRTKIAQTFKFNTTIEEGNVQSTMKQFLAGVNYTKCPTRDLDPFQKCIPVNCEEKYFGKRGFFDHESKLCVPVPNCTGDGILYDMFENECVDTKHFFSQQDIEMIQRGCCDNHTWNLRRSVVIFATVGIYLTICFCIFLIIAWMSKRNILQIPSEMSVASDSDTRSAFSYRTENVEKIR